MGDEWMNGHYEVQGHITVSLELRGKTGYGEFADIFGTEHTAPRRI